MEALINSEIGALEGVIVHKPGIEVENMTPENAERALYSDILNLSIVTQEYSQFFNVLKKVTTVFEVKKLLIETLHDETVKTHLLRHVFSREELPGWEIFLESAPEELAAMLIEGIPLERNNLTNFLSSESFLIRPLHNLFFTRDSSMGMNGEILLGKMANPVRERETLIMDAIFRHHPDIQNKVINPSTSHFMNKGKLTLEGGDFLVARNDIFIIGLGSRTNTHGIDFILETLKHRKGPKHHVIVQELPQAPESFIHLDMIFTLLDRDYCMAYNPVIFKTGRYRTIHIVVDNGQVTSISEGPNIPAVLKKAGMDLKPVFCGGTTHAWAEEREQWHSGANFFAFAPGKIIGYERNVNTLEALNNNGFDILGAKEVIDGSINTDSFHKCVVTVSGSELARGGGGARCMTMPFRRTEVDW